MRTKHIFVLIHNRHKGDVGTMKFPWHFLVILTCFGDISSHTHLFLGYFLVILACFEGICWSYSNVLGAFPGHICMFFALYLSVISAPKAATYIKAPKRIDYSYQKQSQNLTTKSHSAI